VAAKTGNIYISETMTDRIETPREIWEFSTTPSSRKLFLGDCDSDRQPKCSRLGRKLYYLGCPSVSVSLDNAYIELVMVDNAELAVGISTLSVIVPEVLVFPVSAAISGCRLLLK